MASDRDECVIIGLPGLIYGRCGVCARLKGAIVRRIVALGVWSVVVQGSYSFGMPCHLSMCSSDTGTNVTDGLWNFWYGAVLNLVYPLICDFDERESYSQKKELYSKEYKYVLERSFDESAAQARRIERRNLRLGLTTR